MNKSIEELLTNEQFRKFVLNPRQGDGDYWESWKKESEGNEAIFEEAKSIIRDFYEPLSPEEFQTEAINFKRKIDITIAEKKDIIRLYENRRPKKNLRLLSIAASIVILVTVAFSTNWFYTKYYNPSDTSYDPTESIIKKVVGKGQKLTHTFRDGTVVKLNSESSIMYPEDFNGEIREVTLSGEAYFDVAHYENWPFIVHSKGIQTRVLGTAFNITSYPENNGIEVALVKGKVEVKVPNQDPVILEPMEMAMVSDNKNKIEVKGFDYDKITSWKDNIILFDKATFESIQFTLERWYNVEFVCTNKPYFEGGYTGEFEDLSLEAVLNGMSTDKFNFKIKGDKVFID